jgi:aldehyde:ferredoxin oxidoreductase
MCKNVGLCMDVIDLESAAALLGAATGVGYAPEQLESYFGRAVERDTRLNRSLGVTRAEDTLPERFLKEPLVEGPTRGSTVDLQRMLDEYYRLHGQ